MHRPRRNRTSLARGRRRAALPVLNLAARLGWLVVAVTLGGCLLLFATLSPPGERVPSPGGLAPAMWVNRRAELAWALGAVILLALPASVLLIALPGERNPGSRRSSRGRSGRRTPGRRPRGGRPQPASTSRAASRPGRRRLHRVALLALLWGGYLWIMATCFRPAVETVLRTAWDWEIQPRLEDRE